MLSKRIIVCMDVKEGRVVKGVKFLGLKDAGDPVELAKEYNKQGADELVFLDITASHEKRDIMIEVVRNVAKEIFIPFTVGGGIRTIEDIREYAESLGFNIKEYEKKGLVTLIQQSISPKKLMTIATPLSIIKSKNIKRVVLESITLFEYTHTSGEMDYRKEVLDFVLKMKESNVTLIVISEKSISNIDEINYAPEDFLFEGLIMLAKLRRGSSFEHCIWVPKMRGQDHLLDIFPFTIGSCFSLNSNNTSEVFPFASLLRFKLTEDCATL